MRLAALLLSTTILGCPRPLTPEGIARDLARCVAAKPDPGWTLAVRCQCVTDARTRCVTHGFVRDCFLEGGFTDLDLELVLHMCAARR